MVMRMFRGSGEQRLDRIDGLIQKMLANDRHSFDLASTALLGGAGSRAIGEEIRQTDREVNESERAIRRELIVHASVHSAIDAPALLMYMSIVKDIERIGDYAKNIFDIAASGADLSHDDDIDELLGYRNRVSAMISDAAQAFAIRDVTQANKLLSAGDAMLDEFDRHVDGLVGSQALGSHAVPRALWYRYLKRIVAHLMNLLSAVVKPLDQLDYFDEKREDRAND